MAIVIAFATLLVILTFNMAIAHGDDYVFNLERVFIDYRYFGSGGVDPLTTQNGLPGRELGSGLDLNFQTSIFQYLYWDNTVHSTTDRYIDSGKEGQFRTVGWKFRLGVRLHDNLDIGYYHHSEHVLDYARKDPFPRRDGLELRFYLYNRKPRMDTIVP